MSESLNDPQEAIIELAREFKDLEHRAVAVYEPIVDAIVGGGSSDVAHIEQTLHGLLGFGGSEDGLRLFKSLCRHYWKVDPAASASYIHLDRDIWDSELPDSDQSNNPETL